MANEQLISLRDLTSKCPFEDHLILCNNIETIDPGVIEDMFNNYNGDMYDEDEECIVPEVYQFWLTSLSEDDAKYVLDKYQGLMLGYSEVLDLWVLGTTTYGMSWEDVMYRVND